MYKQEMFRKTKRRYWTLLDSLKNSPSEENVQIEAAQVDYLTTR